MSEPFLAEVRIVGFNFAPRGWALCDGQILPISQNQSLYSLLGTTYGGDGRNNFALPDLRGRTPIHIGEGQLLGSKGGQEAVSLSVAEIPNHDHKLKASSTAGDTQLTTGTVPAQALNGYAAPGTLVALRPSSVATTGSGQGHNNMQPYLAFNFCIALRGLFPSRN